MLSSLVCRLHPSGGREPLSAARPSTPEGSLRGLGCVCPDSFVPGASPVLVCWAFPVLGAHSPVSARVPRVTRDLASEFSQSLPQSQVKGFPQGLFR